jgi:uncharacterized membrane protein
MSAPPRPISARRLRHTLGTLVFASAVCVLMWCVRAGFSRSPHFFGFVWNLFLAWIPLWLALLLRRECGPGPLRKRAWLIGLAWLLFLPNSFYIVTDLIHFKKFGMGGIPKMFDVMMTFAFAAGGMFLGCLSLYLMQLSVRERRGWKIGWAFAIGILALVSLGVYLGRDLRLNSWDVLMPWKLFGRMAGLGEPAKQHYAGVFIAPFFLLSVAVYAFVVSMTRIHELEEVTTESDQSDRSDQSDSP